MRVALGADGHTASCYLPINDWLINTYTMSGSFVGGTECWLNNDSTEIKSEAKTKNVMQRPGRETLVPPLGSVMNGKDLMAGTSGICHANFSREIFNEISLRPHHPTDRPTSIKMLE